MEAVLGKCGYVWIFKKLIHHFTATPILLFTNSLIVLKPLTNGVSELLTDVTQNLENIAFN
jgi:hypothetical protein